MTIKQYAIFLGFFIFFLATSVVAQDSLSTIVGKAVDKADGRALHYATVHLLKMNMGAIANGDGSFEIKNLPAGQYSLECSYVGYAKSFKTITLEAGRKVTILFELEPLPIDKIPTIIWETSTSTLLRTREIYSVPAVYDDPARVTALRAGVVNTNDQGNAIAVRGNAPNGLKWYLEGIEIPNPNHTPNAGTPNDRSAGSAGGTNMIKPQFLSHTAFQNSAFDADYGNALGGVLAMQTRQYGAEKPETVLQIGLIGLEVMHNRRFSENGFLHFSGRYSTVGLLSNVIGLDFGGEKISFTDYNFSLYKPIRSGFIKFFSVFGTSSNIYEGQRDTANWTVQKDRFDIDFLSQTTINGVRHFWQNGKSSWNTTLAFSTWNSSRKGYLLTDNFDRILLEKDSLAHQRFSFKTTYQYDKFSANLNATFLKYGIENFDSQANFTANGQLNGWLLEPNLKYHLFDSRSQKITLGLHAMYFSNNQSFSLEPRLSFIKNIERFGSLTLSYGLHSQMQTAEVYLSRDANDALVNENLGFSKAHHFNLGWSRNQKNSGFKAVAYYQHLFNIPIIDNSSASFSTINDINTFLSTELVNIGTGRNYGLELTYRQSFDNDFYISTNLTVFESKYTAGDGIERDTRFNGKHTANLIVGKEWQTQNLTNDKAIRSHQLLGFYVRGLYAGGLRESPIDFALSQLAGQTVFVDSEAFSLSQGKIMKIDARLYWKKNILDAANTVIRSHTIAFDIQNLTNQQNVAFNYFDALQGQVITKYQLGLIPLLSWRVAF